MTAVAAAPAVHTSAAAELRRVPLGELIASPWNPRKHFNDDTMEEMAESLRQKGQLTPLLVRPVPPKLPGSAVAKYEIGAGHRRFFAAPMAGLTHLLVVVRNLDDVAFLELLTIENRQREDLQPLDEAAGFRLLMEKAGYDVAKVSARIGLSVKYVYDRLKLLQLVPAAKQLLEHEDITAGHAILLARLSREDQARVIDADEGGLFQDERIHDELELKGEPRKPVSVRELETWINDHVRQRPESIDPFLFPETVQQLTVAKQAAVKVVHITHDWTASDDVRHDGSKERVYGEQSWKRADGKQKSKPCPYSALGVVVSGYGQGEAFKVCVRRDKCTVHWGARKKSTVRSGTPKRDPYSERLAREERERKVEEAERARWKQAGPALLQALADKVEAGAVRPGSPVWSVIERWLRQRYRGQNGVKLGKTAESLARGVAYQVIAGELRGYSWRPWQEFPAALKPLGIDAKAIVDKVAPKPKPVEKGS